ncbi:MAG: NAD(P)H-dependent oxidoreductase, partial [Bacteroidia bacterium]|nr:NAD(P)H-dependent oxidoreductase [Bacteroidia bacterium]
TNREDSHTEKIARHYESVLKEKGELVNYLSLKDLPSDFISSDLYGKRSEVFQQIIDKDIVHQHKFVFVSPEYNGSFAGILKVFLEAIPPRLWVDNKACLVGVSSGRAGNLRGMEHLTNILNYLKVNVYHNKLPISRVDTLMNGTGIKDEETLKVIDQQLDGFLRF